MDVVSLTLLVGILSTTTSGQIALTKTTIIKLKSSVNEKTMAESGADVTNTEDVQHNENEEECICTPYYSCRTPSESSQIGDGVIDVRINLAPCPSYMDVCCKDGKAIDNENQITGDSKNNAGKENNTNNNEGNENNTNNNEGNENNTNNNAGNENNTNNNEGNENNTNNNAGTENNTNNNECVCGDTKKPNENSAPPKHTSKPESGEQATEKNYAPDHPTVTPEHYNPVTDSTYVGEPKCGIWNRDGVGFRVINAINGESQYGEFPSMVAIFRVEESANGDKKLIYHCGGSLIETNVVLTAAHCVIRKDVSNYMVRAGEWDLKTEKEVYTHQDRRVSKIVTHKGFYSGGLHNDVGLIFTEEPFILQKHIQLVCLPEEQDVYDGTLCFSSGWGMTVSHNNYTVFKKTKSGTSKEIGQYEYNILKNVDLPMVPRDECTDALKTTRLGPKFMLHESFVCAGGEEGKDTCTGDGGSPLVCPSKNDPNYLVQVGIVSWGIDCGLKKIPGLYANVAGFRKWIENEIAHYQTAK